MNWTIVLIVAGTALFVALVINLFKQRRLIKELKAVAKSLEESKAQIIAEQERTKRLKQEMTNNIAHELKTPVSSIMGFLDILLGDKPLTEERQRYYLQRCHSQGERLTDLISDVSLINKLEESADLFPKEQLSLRDVVCDVVADLGEACASQNVTVNVDLPERLIVNGNKNLLYSIFKNLIDNTVAYAGSGVTVRIECYNRTDDKFYIKYSDNGVGIDESFLPRLFDRFVRIDEGRSRKKGGTGLGLSIVKHAVQFHGGDIYVRNADNGGLEFYFSLNRN